MGADSRSRGRTAWLAVAGVALVAVVVTGALWGLRRDDDGDRPGANEHDAASGQPEAAGTTGTISEALADDPAGRWVGAGHTAVLVPAAWQTNDLHCGTPQSDTVVVDVGATCMALVPRPAGVESISVWDSPDLESKPGPGREVTLNGVEATDWDATCAPLEQWAQPGEPSPRPEQLCTAWVWVEADSVQFVAEAATAERAEELLSTVRSDPRLSALPGPDAFWLRELDRAPEAEEKRFGSRYVRSLRDLGFEVDVVREPHDMAGWVLGTDPEPGTMLEPGERVRVTVGD